ncbi:hypothetical protein [Enterococcus raffinosus]|uniref:hypothetical protein n=1 Tax=Enterococcus raffinosus TaxID=71452 RepID=UPI003AC5F852
MLFVVKKEIDGKTKYEVFEEEDPHGAMKADTMDGFFTEDGKLKEPEGKEVAITGVFEVGQVNHLVEISNNFETHRYYREVLEKLGFDPNTYEKLESDR